MVVSIVVTVGLYKPRVAEKFMVVGLWRVPAEQDSLGPTQNQNQPNPGRKHRSLKKRCFLQFKVKMQHYSLAFKLHEGAVLSRHTNNSGQKTVKLPVC